MTYVSLFAGMRTRNNKGQYIKRDTGLTFEGQGVWLDKKGYATIWLNGKNIKLHVLVWERAFGKKPRGYQIHHRDNNKANFSLDNLLLVNQSEHFRIHAGWIKTGGEWSHKPCNRCNKTLPLTSFYERKGLPPTALCKPCHCIVTNARGNYAVC